MADPGIALIIGAGDATGGALARRFARGGFTVCLTRRDKDKLKPLIDEIGAEGGTAHGFGSDTRREEQVEALVGNIERDIGAIDVAIYNVGGNVRFPVSETTARVYYKVWEMCAFGGFLAGRAVARRMLARERGTIFFTGATASLRGGDGFAAFAGGKHALRALAQSMARELGPKNIHVAHVVVDGMIDTEFTKTRFADAYARLKPQDGILDPDAIAETYWMLHHQPRSAWTHEIDVRPWLERF